MHATHRHAVFRLGAARAISYAGSEAAYLALVALVYHKTGSAYWVSAAVLAMVGAATLAGPFAGALGDRHDRRLVMIGSDLTAAAAFLGIALVHQPWLLVVLAGLAAVLESPFQPASQASVPNIVPADQVAWANSTLTTAGTFGQIVGPLAGGLLVALVGPSLAFVLNAASFVASALLVASIRGSFGERREGQREHRGLAAGFAWLRHDAIVRALTVADAVVLFGVGPVLVAERPLAGHFGLGDIGFGLLVASWGGGAIIGSQLAKPALRRTSEGWLIVLGSLGMAVAFALVAVSPVFVGVLTGMVIGGYANGHFNVAYDTLVQVRTPDGVRSRVLAASQTISLGAFTISLAAGGPLVAWLGPQPVYALAAVGCIAAALLVSSLREHAATAVAT